MLRNGIKNFLRLYNIIFRIKYIFINEIFQNSFKFLIFTQTKLEVH